MDRAPIEQALLTRAAELPPGLRDRYDQFHRTHNLRFLLLINLLAQAAYFSYGLADALVVPDIWRESLWARSLFIAATLPVVLLLFRRPIRMEVLDQLLPGLIALAALVWFELLNRSSSALVMTYQYASLIFIVLANLGVRVHFRPALAWSLVITAVIGQGVFRLCGGFTAQTMVFALVYLPVLFFSLFISWTATHHGRRAFLRGLLGEMTSSELQLANERLRSLADTDPLTGLANRRQFDQEAARAWARSQTLGQPLALLMVDIDHFKLFNDHYGHLRGDACLVDIARELQRQLREGEFLVGRWGGEEFAVLLGAADHAKVGAVAHRLVTAVQQLAIPHEHRPDGRGRVTLSVGGALSTEAGVRHFDQLMALGDARLYQAKHAGRDRAVLA